MKITMYELLGMIKDGKAGDITTNFMFERKKYNLLAFLDEYTLDINSLNWEVEIIEEEKKIPEKLKSLNNVGNSSDIVEFKDKQQLNNNLLKDKLNEIIKYLDYLKSKGE